MYLLTKLNNRKCCFPIKKKKIVAPNVYLYHWFLPRLTYSFLIIKSTRINLFMWLNAYPVLIIHSCCVPSLSPLKFPPMPLLLTKRKESIDNRLHNWPVAIGRSWSLAERTSHHPFYVNNNDVSWIIDCNLWEYNNVLHDFMLVCFQKNSMLYLLWK